jgi:hypothetical protein
MEDAERCPGWVQCYMQDANTDIQRMSSPACNKGVVCTSKLSGSSVEEDAVEQQGPSVLELCSNDVVVLCSATPADIRVRLPVRCADCPGVHMPFPSELGRMSVHMPFPSRQNDCAHAFSQ